MTRIAIAAACLLAAVLAQPAVAEHPSCAERAVVIRHLAHNYSEQPVAIGLASNGGVVELLRSSSGGTWTIIITKTDGTACMIAAVEHWELVPPHMYFTMVRNP